MLSGKTANRMFIIAYVLVWLAAVILLWMVWMHWPAWLTWPLALLTALLVPDIGSLKEALSGHPEDR